MSGLLYLFPLVPSLCIVPVALVLHSLIAGFPSIMLDMFTPFFCIARSGKAGRKKKKSVQGKV